MSKLSVLRQALYDFSVANNISRNEDYIDFYSNLLETDLGDWEKEVEIGKTYRFIEKATNFDHTAKVVGKCRGEVDLDTPYSNEMTNNEPHSTVMPEYLDDIIEVVAAPLAVKDLVVGKKYVFSNPDLNFTHTDIVIAIKGTEVLLGNGYVYDGELVETVDVEFAHIKEA